MNTKSPKDSAVDNHTYKVFPNDLNNNDTIFGGQVMAILDRLALVVAERHSGMTCVTASVDALHFLAPARRGDVLLFQAAINRSWRSSMEIGVRVFAEDIQKNQKTHIVSAYFTFVALDESGVTVEVPEVSPETIDEQRRYEEAEIRRNNRRQAALERKKHHENKRQNP